MLVVIGIVLSAKRQRQLLVLFFVLLRAISHIIVV